jgi:hypothetical protein
MARRQGAAGLNRLAGKRLVFSGKFDYGVEEALKALAAAQQGTLGRRKGLAFSHQLSTDSRRLRNDGVVASGTIPAGASLLRVQLALASEAASLGLKPLDSLATFLCDFDLHHVELLRKKVESLASKVMVDHDSDQQIP